MGRGRVLDRAKITRHRQITRTALILLGRPESVALLPSGMAEMLWKVPDERVSKHFGPPFILNTTALGQHIRNPNIKLFPANELLAVELPRYDTQVVLGGPAQLRGPPGLRARRAHHRWKRQGACS
ncbi:MAG: hypothetical protein IPJ18_03800 [Betaproteobacteria bacterium]|nr:hypothetical protein [Betaproteobacteria bacterium]